ncbi:hypothetical protein RIR_e35262_A0A2I1EPJ9_9GLOM [Rhizophagus irregularis DAOM 181602=DAOM 197198]|nr:hypothetical protein RIR_e35262_A0A2I1EPJ9_9GLOM [Rhizophagus irregularis DAOM 181602=DAOM 197198]CAG8590007.1 7562_t:CDS:2 [Rhizophagus irregularis]
MIRNHVSWMRRYANWKPRKIKNLMNSKKDLEAEITKLENRNRELEVDLTVKERMRLEKGEEIKIISGKLTELEQKKDTD